MNYIKKIVFSLLLTGFGLTAFGQKYYTKEGVINFYSDASLEKIEAVNKRVTAVIDIESGAVEFALLIKAFQFEKALMQEHFNENYMESDKFPKAVFKGKIINMESINLGEDGKYTASVAGQLTIHGETKDVETVVAFTVEGKMINASTKFIIACADYDIKIPKLVADNIAKEVEVSVMTDLQPLVK